MLPRAEVPALVLGHGITQLGVLRHLSKAGIPVFAVNEPEDFVRHSRYYRAMPGLRTPPSPRRLLDLLSHCPFPRAVLVPCADDWLEAVAALPPEWREYFPASVSAPELVRVLTDKWLFAELLAQYAIPRPRTICVQSIEEAEALPEEFFAGAFLKPRDSLAFSRRYKVKVFTAENKKEALRHLRRAFADGLAIMLQEFIPGPPEEHYLIEGFVDRHGAMTVLGRRRLRMHPQRFGNSCFMESVPMRKVQGAVDSLQKLFAAAGFRGLCGCEFKLDPRDGQFKLIEINGRPWWHLDFAEHCGLPVARMAYWDALGVDVPQVKKYRAGRRGVILSQDWQAYRTLSKEGKLSFASWLTSCLFAHDLIFRWSDPLPALAQMWKAVKPRPVLEAEAAQSIHEVPA